MKVRLTSNDMWLPALEFTVEQFPTVIGRNGKSDIALDDRWASAQHCELRQVDGELLVRDLHSKHGTIVNGQRVQQSVVKSGDTLIVGIRSFRVSYRRKTRQLRSSTSEPVANLATQSEEAGVVAN